MRRLITYLCCAPLLLAALSFAPAVPANHLGFLSLPAGKLQLPNLELSVSSYPQALPNDGFSEAVISVALVADGKPLADEKVEARVVRGDGKLIHSEVVTDSAGVATFAYRAGMLPETGKVELSSPAHSVAAELSIPLAPVAYLDVLLVTPEEYQAHLQRQASAAPIYKLEASVFPAQLAADGGSLACINARLLHVDGKPAPGVPLTAEVISGDGQVLLEQKATDSEGKFELHFVAGRMPGTATIQLMEPSTGLTYAANILLVEAGPARIELSFDDPFSAEPGREGAILPADGSTGLKMRALVKDLGGMPLTGVEVRLEILDTHNGRMEVQDPVTDMTGAVEFTYHAGTFTGPVRLRAFIADGMRYSTALLVQR